MAEASWQVSVAEASLLIKSIDDLTQCAVCNETLTRPKLLPCFHTFCLGCLQKSFADCQPGEHVACLLCRRVFAVPADGLDALPAHFFVENLLDAKKISQQLAVQRRCDVCCDDDGDGDDDNDDDQSEIQFATSYCGQCAQFLCNQCSKCHKRQTSTKGHAVVSMSDELRPDQCIASRCSQHQDELLKLYCNDCQLVCCLVCFAESHKQHDCSHLDKVGEVFRGEIQSDIDSMTNAVVESEREEKAINHEHKEFLECVKSVESAVIKQKNELKQMIDRQADWLLREVKVARQRREEEVSRRKQDVQLNRLTLINFQQYSEQVKDKGTLVDIASSVTQLRSRATELLSDHAQVIASRLQGRRITFSPAAVLNDKVNVVGSIRCDDEVIGYKLLCSSPGDSQVRGLVLVDDSLYVVRKKSAQIDVFHPTTLTSLKTMPLPAATDAGCMAGCQTLKSLYITCFINKELLKVGLTGDTAVERWKVSNGSPDGVSVSPNCNVVVVIRDTGHLVIFSPTGQVVSDIKLAAELVSPRHALQLQGDGEFLLCHGWGPSVYGISVVDGNGRITKSSSAAAVAAATDVGLSRPKSFSPTHLALVAGGGSVLAAEFSGNAVQLYNRKLDYVGDVSLDNAQLQKPFRLCVDNKSGRLYVGEYGGQTRVLVFGR